MGKRVAHGAGLRGQPGLVPGARHVQKSRNAAHQGASAPVGTRRKASRPSKVGSSGWGQTDAADGVPTSFTQERAVTAPRLLFLVTEDWYFVSHRLPMA